MTQEDRLKREVKESVKNVVRRTADDVSSKIANIATKRALKKLKRKITRKAASQLKNPSDKTTQKLTEQLNKQVRQLTDSITKNNFERADFFRATEKSFENSFRIILPSTNPFIAGAIITVLAGSAVFGVAEGVIPVSMTNITIHNDGQQPIQYDWLGSGVISPNDEHIFPAPAVNIRVRRNEEGFTISYLGIDFPFIKATSGTTVSYNGMPLQSGIPLEIDLRTPGEHNIEIAGN